VGRGKITSENLNTLEDMEYQLETMDKKKLKGSLVRSREDLIEKEIKLVKNIIF
jgi:hypothetical protein